jgi:hypothetical protein
LEQAADVRTIFLLVVVSWTRPLLFTWMPS